MNATTSTGCRAAVPNSRARASARQAPAGLAPGRSMSSVATGRASLVRGKRAVCRIADNDIEIENLDTNYCDDFECTSSPAVAETVRGLSRDLCRVNTWTKNLFQPSVEFKDGLRSFSGREGYERNTFIAESIQDPKVEILKVEMLDKSVSQITWRLTGKVGPLDMSAENQSKFTHNLLTGRVEVHEDVWNLTCGGPAAAALTAARTAWALKMASSDAAKASVDALDSLGSVDEGEYDLKDASDPTKFFNKQQNENDMNDAIGFITFCAVMYTIFKAYEALNTL